MSVEERSTKRSKVRAKAKELIDNAMPKAKPQEKDSEEIDSRGFVNLHEEFQLEISAEGVQLKELGGLDLIAKLSQPEDTEKIIIRRELDKLTILFE